MNPELATLILGSLTIISGVAVFLIRASLKSNCIELSTPCCKCKREREDDPRNLEVAAA
jgi:hypothetical protein